MGKNGQIFDSTFLYCTSTNNVLLYIINFPVFFMQICYKYLFKSDYYLQY